MPRWQHFARRERLHGLQMSLCGNAGKLARGNVLRCPLDVHQGDVTVGIAAVTLVFALVQEAGQHLARKVLVHDYCCMPTLPLSSSI